VIDPKLLRSDPMAVARNLARRGYKWMSSAEGAGGEAQALPGGVDRLRSERNVNAKSVGMAKGRGEDVAPLIAKGEQLTQAWRKPKKTHGRAGGARTVAAWSS